MIRVAICLSGQPRAWRSCLLCWERLFAAHGEVGFDVFFHLWDHTTAPSLVGLVEPQPISLSEGQSIIDYLNPTAHLFESAVDARAMIDEIDHRNPDPLASPPAAVWAASQFYSMMRAAHLKRAYEIANGFQYDVCVRVRSDLVFLDQAQPLADAWFPRPATIHAVHCGHDAAFGADRCGDLFFYADSPTFDLMTDFFRWMPMMREADFGDRGVPPEIPFQRFAESRGIAVQPIHGLDPKLCRDPAYGDQLASRGLSLGSHEVIGPVVR